MYRATKDIILPTTITGSLPRPELVHGKSRQPAFPRGDGHARFREQYEDALTCYLRDRSSPASTFSATATAASTTIDVGGQSWTAIRPTTCPG